MNKFIELTQIEYERGIPIETFKVEIPVCINVAHIVYLYPKEENCTLCFDDQGARTIYKEHYTAHSSAITVKESYEEVKKRIIEQ